MIRFIEFRVNIDEFIQRHQKHRHNAVDSTSKIIGSIPVMGTEYNEKCYSSNYETICSQII